MFGLPLGCARYLRPLGFKAKADKGKPSLSSTKSKITSHESSVQHDGRTDPSDQCQDLCDDHYMMFLIALTVVRVQTACSTHARYARTRGRDQVAPCAPLRPLQVFGKHFGTTIKRVLLSSSPASIHAYSHWPARPLGHGSRQSQDHLLLSLYDVKRFARRSAATVRLRTDLSRQVHRVAITGSPRGSQQGLPNSFQ